MDKPKVSVITVCRNCREQLQATMKSIDALIYPNLEYIVVDGASTDGTPEMLGTYGGRLSRWVSEADGGIYDAMNKGARMATGEWIVFMNAGDTFAAPDILDRVFAEKRHADVIYGDVVKGGTVKKAEPPHNSHRMFFCHQSAIVSARSVRSHPFDTSHPMSADFKQMKLLYLGGARFMQLPIAIACFDTGGVSNTLRSRGLRDNIAVIREVDTWKEQLRLLPRLLFVYWLCRLLGK